MCAVNFDVDTRVSKRSGTKMWDVKKRCHLPWVSYQSLWRMWSVFGAFTVHSKRSSKTHCLLTEQNKSLACRIERREKLRRSSGCLLCASLRKTIQKIPIVFSHCDLLTLFRYETSLAPLSSENSIPFSAVVVVHLIVCSRIFFICLKKLGYFPNLKSSPYARRTVFQVDVRL